MEALKFFAESDRQYAGIHSLGLDRRQCGALVRVLLAGLEDLAGQTGAAAADVSTDGRAELIDQVDIVEHLLEELIEAFPDYHPPGAPRTLELPLVWQ